MDVDQDLRLALGWNRVNLKLVGIWPEPTATEHASRSYRTPIIIMWLTIFKILPQITDLFMLNGDLIQITDNLCSSIIPTSIAIGKILVVLYYREGLRLLVKCFYDDWRGPKTEEERTAMLTAAKVWTFISTWCTVLSYVLITAFVGVRVFMIYTYDRYQESQAQFLLYHSYFPYNLQVTSLLVLTNACQAVACCCDTISYASIDAFICMLVLHTCSQFENLRMRLEGLMDDENGTRSMDHVHTELVWIVRRHEHLNWVASRIEEYFNVLMLIQTLLCTVEICIQGFSFSNIRDIYKLLIRGFALSPTIYRCNMAKYANEFVFFVLYIGYVVVHIYLYCYIGEMLLVQSYGMATSAYNSNWFNVSSQEAKCLLFIMHRSVRPLRLTAGKFSTFSIEMFSTILRTAMGYLSVLLTVAAGND